ncbi:hypothetical protein H5410_027634 [Solanum commersonii]|uniref:Uncharacterized protein n=1 Tax=Solanum commersonii TaxID=4109 RepID=A0A9J5Z517_SOLCO|nr:hypothetical protein H5410_027634 [Solanum commersonii]
MATAPTASAPAENGVSRRWTFSGHRVSPISGNDSPNHELQYTTKSSDFIVSIARSKEANSGKISTELPKRRL